MSGGPPAPPPPKQKHKKLVFPLLFVLVDEPVEPQRETVTTTANGTSATEVLDFVYGSGSTLLALVYTNGTASPVTYYYITNIQGDVAYMVDGTGNEVVCWLSSGLLASAPKGW